MKKNHALLTLSIGLMCAACYKPGDIQVQNNISRAVIEDVQWGDNFLASELLPGQASNKRTIEREEEKLPSTHTLTFKIRLNGKTVFLQTDESFLLDEDGDLLITLEDGTKVGNPAD